MSPARTRTTLAALTVTLALTACSLEEPDVDTAGPTRTAASTSVSPSVSPSPSQTVVVSASPSPYASPFPTVTGEPGEGDDVAGDASADGSMPFYANTETDTREPSGSAQLSVVDVRLGRHEGFDRVVFELGGSGGGTPGWTIGYTDDPRQQGSGDAVDVAGSATLDVRIRGTSYPTETSVERYEGPNPRAVRSTELVTEVFLGSVFEGITEAFIGVEREVPFRAYLLEDPVRVVVEVAER